MSGCGATRGVGPQHGPQGPCQFARDRDIRHGRELVVSGQSPVPPMELLLRPVGHRHRPAGLVGPLLPERHADVRRVAVVPRGFHRHAPDAAVAGPGDRPPPLSRPAAELARGESEIPHQLRGAAETRDIAEFGQHGHRRHGVDPAEAVQPTHRLTVVGTGRARGELLPQRVAALLHALKREQIVVIGGLRCGGGQSAA